MLFISFFSETGAEKLWVSFGMGKKLRYYISLVMSNMNWYPCDAAFAACNMTVVKRFMVTWTERTL